MSFNYIAKLIRVKELLIEVDKREAAVRGNITQNIDYVKVTELKN